MKLDVGSVLYLPFYTTTPPKPKHAIVVANDPRYRFFLINTAPNDFQAKRPKVMAGIVEIYKSNDTYLHHDSVVDCNEWQGYPDNVDELIAKEPHRYKGAISRQARRAIRKGVTDSHELIGIVKQQLLGIL